jgi:asparagine synthase (glutamine-hydrolysing)
MASQAKAMSDALRNRGPDGSDEWVDAASGLALAHRRLAILDLSPTGRQPMQSGDARFVITYNGEVYNHQELRSALSALGATFRGTSDTEVLLEGFCRWGVEATLRRCIGMFALAVYDAEQRRLTLARDRFGEKPLYYGIMGAALLFGSDPSALAAHHAFRGGIDRDALAQYLRYGYVPTPRCILQSVSKLPPGCLAEFEAAGTPPRLRRYWDPLAEARKAMAGPAIQVDALDRLLRKTVRNSMASDVSLGVFLSGGIDSSLVTALMQAESVTPVHTFTIGFREASHNEAEWAAAVARHVGTHHTELYVTAEEARAVIPLLPTMYQEPFADSSQIPTYLVSRLARQHVTVALSGDGGDELFGGYMRYIEAAPRIRAAQRLPSALRKGAGWALQVVPNAVINGVGRIAPGLRPSWRKAARDGTLAERAKKFAAALESEGAEGHYQRLVSTWPDPHLLLTKVGQPVADERVALVRDEGLDLVERMMLFDTVAYLPDDILVKVDRAAMAVSLEARAPLLSHEVFAAAWSLPLGDKVHHGGGKWILRKVLDRYVPRHLVERPKTGFGVPLAEWLRGPLRDWAEGLLAPNRLIRDGLLDPRPIRQAWEEHLSGRRDRHAQLWVILMFNAWLDAHRAWFQGDATAE